MQAQTSLSRSGIQGGSANRYAQVLESTLSRSKALLGTQAVADFVQPSFGNVRTTTTSYSNTGDLIRANVSQDLKALNVPIEVRNTQGTNIFRPEATSRVYAEDSPENYQEAKRSRIEQVESLRRTTALEPRQKFDNSTVQPSRNSGEEDTEPASKYHTLKHQSPPQLTKDLVQFLASRINPPQCVLELLDALISLVFGVFTRVEQHYFALGEKKYFLYKQYLSYSEELLDVTRHLKLYIETQGLPERNVSKAEAALGNYSKSKHRPEAKSYMTTVAPLVGFLEYHISYYRILKVDLLSHRNSTWSLFREKAPFPHRPR